LSKNKKVPLSCDWKDRPQKNKKQSAGKKSILYKYKGKFTWKGIKNERYKVSGRDWSDIIRKTFIGNHGETTKFHLRYFEISPGGYSSFEMHRHEHVVIGIRGKGICVIKKKKYIVNYLDTVYIEPSAPHQLRNPYKEPFGFFCIVNAQRDKPKLTTYPSHS
jgi:ribulose-bisphosphate carboxylase large chain